MPSTAQQPSIQVAHDVAGSRRIVAGRRAAGETIALIPTMGALHDGHLALVAEGRKRARRISTSIFIMCPKGFATRIHPSGAAEGLETDFRPQCFGGVATVCCKLCTQTGADRAMFSEKDYEQLPVVRQMVRDPDLPVEIVRHPTVREADGLAMSSRNVCLPADGRRLALTIYREIQSAAEVITCGVDIDAASARAGNTLDRAGFTVGKGPVPAPVSASTRK